MGRRRRDAKIFPKNDDNDDDENGRRKRIFPHRMHDKLFPLRFW